MPPAAWLLQLSVQLEKGRLKGRRVKERQDGEAEENISSKGNINVGGSKRGKEGTKLRKNETEDSMRTVASESDSRNQELYEMTE